MYSLVSPANVLSLDRCNQVLDIHCKDTNWLGFWEKNVTFGQVQEVEEMTSDDGFQTTRQLQSPGCVTLHSMLPFSTFLWVHCTQSSVLVVWTDCSQFILKGHQALSAFLLEDKARVMRFKGLWKNIWHFRHDLLTEWLTVSLVACGIKVTDLSANWKCFHLFFRKPSLIACCRSTLLLLFAKWHRFYWKTDNSSNLAHQLKRFLNLDLTHMRIR